MPTATETERYTVISADTHGGASHATYREYLESKYHEEFDAWRGKYKNPFRDLGDNRRLRNWDNEMRTSQQLEDGIVGEVVFPNTVPPFFPSFVLFARPPEDGHEYELRRAGIRAHNRWLKDWCGEYEAQRAGVGQIFLNDVDDAIEDATWIKENGIRGGLLLPNIAPDVKHVKPVYDPIYDPLWKVCEELQIPINVHSGTGSPDYGPYPVAAMLQIVEVGFYSQRPLVQFTLGGIFERFPGLRFVITELGCSWVPGILAQLDRTIEGMRRGQMGELRYGAEHALPRSATEYFHQSVWMGVSMAGPADVAVRHQIGIDRFMWGSDYPHDEGTYPNSRQALQRSFHNVDRDETRMMLSENAAKLYDFDLAKLAPLAAEVGPEVSQVHTEPVAAG